MGFLDRASNKVKSVTNQTISKFDESSEVNKINSKIREEKNKVKANYSAIGKDYYRYKRDGDEAYIQDADKLVTEIEESRILIEGYEKEIEDIRARRQEERNSIKADEEARRQEIEAADAVKKEQKAQTKTQQAETSESQAETSKTEDDDLF